LLKANFIFMGPGSPTYAIRQLQGSLAWDVVRARHRLGATLVFASAATIAVGAWALPVYEIYKVGLDVHTLPGLNLFEDFGVPLSFIPHWNNTDGGIDVDTSRCFIGMDRFAQWCSQVPPGHTILGLDEHTGIILDFEEGKCRVAGVSSVTLVRECNPEIYPAGSSFPLLDLGNLNSPSPLQGGISPEAWELTRDVPPLAGVTDGPPPAVLALAERRQAARSVKDWALADSLRREMDTLGWSVQDTPEGPKIIKV
jgi:hypothetical protein